MKINYIFFKFLFLTGLMTSINSESGAAEERRSSMFTKHDMAYMEFTENQEKKKIGAEKAWGNAEDPVRNDTNNLDNNIFYADEWIKGWFVRLDKDGDNIISKDEFEQNMEPFTIEEKHLAIFDSKELNADGVLNLIEFQNFIDSTNFLSKDEIAEKKAAIGEEADDIDTIKLFAGVLAISLLMAAFKFA